MRHTRSKVDQFCFWDLYAPAAEKKPRSSIVIAGRQIAVTPVFFAYWQFATERQRIFFRRIKQEITNSLTSDAILSKFKFTNAYRASDRVSQYLIRNVIYRDDLPNTSDEIFFRILLFKIFNKIETWEHLQNTFGQITLRDYSFEAYDTALTSKMSLGDRIYSAAYIMPSGGSAFRQAAKHKSHLLLIEYMLRKNFPNRLLECRSMNEAYVLFLSAPSIGPFLAYQYATDINYSELTNFSEAEFVVAGPGALDGIKKCFHGLGDVSAEHVIRHMFINQERYFLEQSLDFQSLWGRPLQLIDCQNIFCEISKYARVAFPEIEGASGRKRIKQKFAVRRELPTPWYPPKWHLNAKIQSNTYFNESPASDIASAVHPTMF